MGPKVETYARPAAAAAAAAAVGSRGSQRDICALACTTEIHAHSLGKVWRASNAARACSTTILLAGGA